MYQTEAVDVDDSGSRGTRWETERERNDLNEEELDSKRGSQGKKSGNVSHLRVENNGTTSTHLNEHEKGNQRDPSLPPSPASTKYHRRRRSSDSPVSPHSPSSHYSYHTLSPSLSPQPTPLKFHSPPLPPPVPPCSNSLENPSNSYSIEHFNQFYENSNGIRRTSRVNHGDLDWIRIELEGFQSGTTRESIESLLGRSLKFWRNLEEVEEGGRRFGFWVHGMNTARSVERQFGGWRLEEGREVRVWIVRGDGGGGDWEGAREGSRVEGNQFGLPPHPPPQARPMEYLREDQERGLERMEERGRKRERSRSIRGRSDRSLSRDHKSHRREKDRDGGRRRSRKYQDEEEDRNQDRDLVAIIIALEDTTQDPIPALEVQNVVVKGGVTREAIIVVHNLILPPIALVLQNVLLDPTTDTDVPALPQLQDQSTNFPSPPQTIHSQSLPISSTPPDDPAPRIKLYLPLPLHLPRLILSEYFSSLFPPIKIYSLSLHSMDKSPFAFIVVDRELWENGEIERRVVERSEGLKSGGKEWKVRLGLAKGEQHSSMMLNLSRPDLGMRMDQESERKRQGWIGIELDGFPEGTLRKENVEGLLGRYLKYWDRFEMDERLGWVRFEVQGVQAAGLVERNLEGLRIGNEGATIKVRVGRDREDISLEQSGMLAGPGRGEYEREMLGRKESSLKRSHSPDSYGPAQPRGPSERERDLEVEERETERKRSLSRERGVGETETIVGGRIDTRTERIERSEGVREGKETRNEDHITHLHVLAHPVVETLTTTPEDAQGPAHAPRTLVIVDIENHLDVPHLYLPIAPLDSTDVPVTTWTRDQGLDLALLVATPFDKNATTDLLHLFHLIDEPTRQIATRLHFSSVLRLFQLLTMDNPSRTCTQTIQISIVSKPSLLTLNLTLNRIFQLIHKFLLLLILTIPLILNLTITLTLRFDLLQTETQTQTSIRIPITNSHLHLLLPINPTIQ
ncbi:hypothetical protein JCM5353_007359 [Sporobolomyces roseus]